MIGVDGIYNGAIAQDILKKTGIDMVAIGRGTLKIQSVHAMCEIERILGSALVAVSVDFVKRSRSMSGKTTFFKLLEWY